jgi:TRAP-type uncharacterized transport system fused permease subunit
VLERTLAALLLFLPLVLFAEVLLQRTHHRPLGAATYSSVAVIAFLLCSAAIAQLSTPRPARLRLAWALGGVGFLIAMSRLIG